MGLFNRKKRRDLAIEGIPGVARIVTCDLITHWGEDSDEVNPLAELGIGRVTYRMEIEVTLEDGRPPYTVTGKFKVPVAHDLADEGIHVPLRADPDDPQRVELDWETLDDVGGFNEELDAARHAATRAGVHDNFPAESRTMMIDGWVAATNGGAMSREDFDRAIDDAVTAGMLDHTEAAAARAALRA